MDDDGNQTVEIVAKDRTLEVGLANPPDNRLTPGMVTRLNEAMDMMESDDFEAMVIIGSKRVFCKGFDVDVLRSYQDAAALRQTLILSNAVLSRIARSPKPTIAAINGACMGAGLELALACHFRLCAEKTRLGLPEVWLNLAPGLGGYYRLAKLIGQAKALELVALGDLVTAEEALRLNVVSRVFPRKDFADHVASFIRALFTADQRVIREIIRLAGWNAAPGEEDNIRQSVETFIKLTRWLQNA